MSDAPDPKAAEARRLWDLGLFVDATHLFEQLVKEKADDFALRMKFAGLKMQQGLIGDCLDMLQELEDKFPTEVTDTTSSRATAFQLFITFCKASTALRFTEPMREARLLWKERLQDLKPEQHDEFTVSAVVIYHGMLQMAKTCGFPMSSNTPCLAAEAQKQLVSHFLKTEKYALALRIASLEDFDEKSFDNTSALKQVFESEKTSLIQKATAHQKYAEKVHKLGRGEEWLEHLNKASALYDEAGHASGSLEIQVEIHKHHETPENGEEVIKDLWAIAARFESLENLVEAGLCLSAIFDLAGKVSVPDLAGLELEVEERIIQVSDRCRSPLLSISYSFTRALRRSFSGAYTAQSLDYLEKLYTRIKDMDMPIIMATLLTTLANVHMALGDQDKAMLCLTRRPEVLPREFQLLLQLDPFHEEIKSATTAPDTETELERLKCELEKVRVIVRTNASVNSRTIEVQRLIHIANRYLLQYQFRGINQVTILSEEIFRVVEELCELLDQANSSLRRGELLQAMALLCSCKACEPLSLQDRLDITMEATRFRSQSVDHFHKAGELVQVVLAEAQTAVGYQLLWNLKENPSDGEDFQTAAACLDRARNVAEGLGNLDQMMNVAQQSIRLWMDYLRKHGSEGPDERNHLSSSAFERAFRSIQEADDISNIKRHDLSVLPRQQAVVAKQILRKDAGLQSILKAAIEAYGLSKDLEGQWSWIQRSKARSISDMLALGINLPLKLRNEIEEVTARQEMMERERNLMLEVGNAELERLMLLRRTLEAHRREMERDAALQQVLHFRRGEPTSLERLKAVAGVGGGPRTFFVDWFVTAECCCIAVVTPSGDLSTVRLDFTPSQAVEWKQMYLHQQPGHLHPLENPGTEPLQQLSSLVRPLIDLTEPGDLLVLCPSDVLHGLPLHAATCDADSTKSLIERNLIVYTASMTTYEQCVLREKDRRKKGSLISRSYVAVVEQTETGALSDQDKRLRDGIYRSIENVAMDLQDDDDPDTTSIHIGRHIGSEQLISALQADSMLFLGHCGTNSQDMLEQHLLLAGRDESNPERFSVSDMFAYDVRVSHLTLLACGSAAQANEGDEPLGIISALLCAGATSVAGTMWKVQARTAEKFAQAMGQYLLDEEEALMEDEGEQSVVNLARVMQNTVLRLKKRADGTGTPYHWAAFVLHGCWFMSR